MPFLVERFQFDQSLTASVLGLVDDDPFDATVVVDHPVNLIGDLGLKRLEFLELLGHCALGADGGDGRS